jgi:two-component sensor histidine kinase
VEFSFRRIIVTQIEIHSPNLGEHVLLHELNHRINNEFAAAIGVVSAAAARSSDQKVKAALTGIRELLHRHADVHRALQMPEDDRPVDVAAYLQRLCVSISRSKLEDREIKLVLSAQSLPLQADQCWRLGMILYELITNAARHAFDSGGGEIRIALRRDGSLIKCMVQDNGSAPARIRPGHGLKIVNELSAALGGRFIARFGPKGSRSLLIMPVEREPR